MFKTPDGQNRIFTFVLVCSLFMLWGLCNGMLDTLNKHFQNSLQVSKAQSGLVQGIWYAAYGLMAIPAGLVATKFGYRGGILAGLAIAAAGCLLFVPATSIVASNLVLFSAFLGALFIIGSGLTFLEMTANSYATVLGPKESSVSRLTLAQSCNGVGWMIGPILGSMFVLSKTSEINTSNATLYLPYVLIAVVILVLFVIFALAPVPDIAAPTEAKAPGALAESRWIIFKEKHFLLGVLSQFCYCAAQTGVFSFFLNYLKDPKCTPPLPDWLAHLLPQFMYYGQDGSFILTDGGAGTLSSVAFALFTLGRFSGSVITKNVAPYKVLGFYGVVNVVLMALVCLGIGWISVGALFLSYFFMSIMYPTNFALAIRGLGEHTKFGASCMVVAIVGGGIMTIIMGWIADTYSMGVGFILPLICFVYIAFYGLNWKSFFSKDMSSEAFSSSPGH